ncbi:MAG: hypothetical protein KF819_26945 [Labilithrix sp.]|nr:hypothetical protein [Labilithrix sp.]
MKGSVLLTAAICALPLVGVVELALHVKQTTSDVVPDTDWIAARDAVKAEIAADDLVVFAPFWADPIGRKWFGDELAGLEREARPDETRFRRAFEVGIRGAHREELAGWKKVSERQAGKITIGVYENPSPVKVLTDLVELVGPERMTVSRVDGNVETACAWQRGQGQPGGLGVPQGPAIPGDRFVCPGGSYVGVAVLHALDHHPHRCFFAGPSGGALRIRFANVSFGASLHGHAGVQWLVERAPSSERITVSFSAFDRPIGASTHKVGVGWTGFELPTGDIAGKKGELVAEISGSAQRAYCFEADTRE